MQEEYDQYREKDPEIFNSKVKTEIDFALLRISEKRYKAEKEAEKLKEVLGKKLQYIQEMEIKMRDLKKLNEDLNSQVIMLEEENKELKLNGGVLTKNGAKGKDGSMKRSTEDGLDVREDLSEQAATGQFQK